MRSGCGLRGGWRTLFLSCPRPAGGHWGTPGKETMASQIPEAWLGQKSPAQVPPIASPSALHSLVWMAWGAVPSPQVLLPCSPSPLLSHSPRSRQPIALADPCLPHLRHPKCLPAPPSHSSRSQGAFIKRLFNKEPAFLFRSLLRLSLSVWVSLGISPFCTSVSPSVKRG